MADPIAKAPGSVSGISEGLTQFAGPYVGEMLGKARALADKPFDAYTGPLTAGASGLQEQAFAGYAGLDPNQQTGIASFGGDMTAGQQFGFGDAAGQGYQAGFTPGSYDLSGMQQGTFQTGYTPGSYDLSGMQQGTFQNTYNPEAFTGAAAQQYMNPYLQAALEPQLREAKRQAEMQRVADAGRLTRAGAFGGSRQAILESEGARNLGTQLADITGRGYSEAFGQAQRQFNTEQQRAMANRDAMMAQFNEQERMRQRIAEVGVDQFNKEEAAKERAEEARRGQFNEQERMRQRIAEVGVDQFNREEEARRQAEEARRGQFNIEAGRQEALDEARRRQFNEEQRREIERQEREREQFNEQERRRIAAEEADRRFGLSALRDMRSAGQEQRDIEQEGITADYLQFQQEQQYPYKQLEFMQSMLQGLPITATSRAYIEPSSLDQLTSGSGDFLAYLNTLLGRT